MRPAWCCAEKWDDKLGGGMDAWAGKFACLPASNTPVPYGPLRPKGARSWVLSLPAYLVCLRAQGRNRNLRTCLGNQLESSVV